MWCGNFDIIVTDHWRAISHVFLSSMPPRLRRVLSLVPMHACDGLYSVTMLIACRCALVIRCYDRFAIFKDEMLIPPPEIKTVLLGGTSV